MTGLRLSRQQLASITRGDQDAIRKLEKLFATVEPLTPEVSSDIEVQVGAAEAKAQQALDEIDGRPDLMGPLISDPLSMSELPDVLTQALADFEVYQWDATLRRFKNVGILVGLKFGGTATDYSFFEPDGTLKFNGAATVWKDLVFPIIPKFTGAGNPSFAAFVGGITAPQFAVNDAVQLDASEFFHEWKEGSEASIHLHYTSMTNVAAARAVKWELGYSYVETTDGAHQWTAETVLQVEHTIPANTPALTEFIVPMGVFTAAAGKVGGQMRMRVKRIAAAGTAPATNPFLTQVGVHLECDTTGSRTVTAK